jgi:predicted unusual protein kinase regulating ubiquinone biosynthesis (AarF/ABC1/UbiB family)
MITYIFRLYTQIQKLYTIKTYINTIYSSSVQEELLTSFESLKKLIFDSGSLYIKIFQWYISKLKSGIINNDTPGTQKHTYENQNQNIIRFINYFEDIFEQCPYHSLNHTKQVFKESMNGITLYDYIDISTLRLVASGSIGQVYYGKRKSDGIEVAIKVKHPNIERDLNNQYELINLIKFLQSISYLRNNYNLVFNIDDFLEDINLQCDFNNEANNTLKFIENFKDSSHFIIFPEPLYQSKDLLISRYIEGKGIDTLSDMQKYQTSLNFICFFKQMLFIDNFIHGDLHCKNWKVRYNEDTKTTQMIIYDCGICFKNTSSSLTIYFWLAIVNYDVEKIIILLKDFIKDSNTISTFNIDDDKISAKFDTDVRLIFKDIIKQSMGTSIVMKSILNLFKRNNIIVHKFLLNFSILICVIEEYMKGNNLINKDINRNVSMFDIMNYSQLDIIAFCEVKKCYPKIKTIFQEHLINNFQIYKTNIEKHKLENNEDETKKLFSSISLSGLTFKPPGSFENH